MSNNTEADFLERAAPNITGYKCNHAGYVLKEESVFFQPFANYVLQTPIHLPPHL